ncbi:MAG: c-type cytochrome [Planctomycetia bacterium]|nr:c-type cytochrome [Planctomycetia bacterium]
MHRLLAAVLATIFPAAIALAAGPPVPEMPKSADPRLVVELFAAAPEIVHPVGLAFDSRGRLLVIESHTHFRPKDYDGPPHDRIRVVEDTDGDGRADRFTTFFEGTKATMDIAAHAGGSIYIATRSEILRLRDANGDGAADQKEQIAFLQTDGDYPHNGLSGLSFDFAGNLYFGMGENLGAAYTLRGSDGKTHEGGGEGGNIFWCTADGKNLRRVATGFWNPFGTCVDSYGRVFAVDNDPDAMPPCRLLHVVEGGDFGYQFRYGRTGRHPFQSWDGQLAGTLPMVSGVGEGPCEVLDYQSDGLPSEYTGSLLVTSWADHRVERHELSLRGASVRAVRKPFIQGGADFRPVGLAVAPDGSLFVSDWVLVDYNLHHRGAIWHIRWKDAPKPARPQNPLVAIANFHRPDREAAARKLAQTESHRELLRKLLRHDHEHVRAVALAALAGAGDQQADFLAVAERDLSVPLRAAAVRALASRRDFDATRFLRDDVPAEVRREAILAWRVTKVDLPRLLESATWDDPFLRQAATTRLATSPKLLDGLELSSLKEPRERVAVLVARRQSGRPQFAERLGESLASADEEERLLAVKWIADERLEKYRAQVAAMMNDNSVNVRMFWSLATALSRLDGQDANENCLADAFLDRLIDDKSPADIRIRALQVVPVSHQRLKLDLLAKLTSSDDDALAVEAVRTLREHPAGERTAALRRIAADTSRSEEMRADAIVGLAGAQAAADDLVSLAGGDSPALAAEALRSLVGVSLTDAQRVAIESAVKKNPALSDLAARVLEKPFAKDRPGADPDAWLKRLEGPADPAAGRRIFFQPKVAVCSRCHRVDGRGQDVGPDLSAIGRRPRRHIVESIVKPAAEVAPHYQPYVIVTRDGRSLTALLLRTYLDEYTWVSNKGEEFKLATRDIDLMQPVAASIMPTNQPDLLTDQELRDLVAYLEGRK